VKGVKARIQDQEGIPPYQQRLIVTGVEMEDDWTLKDYGLQPDAIVHLVFQSLVKKPLCKEHVIVMTLTGKAIQIKVTENLTVMD